MSWRKGLNLKIEYLPICVRLQGHRCLVIGGGKVAFRKIKVLRRSGASVTCISPYIVQDLNRLKDENKIKYIKRPYSPKISFKAYKLVVAATDNPYINKQIAEQARREKTLVNVVNTGTQGDVIMPAILKKKDVVVAVSTDGRNPSRAKRIRDGLRDVL